MSEDDWVLIASEMFHWWNGATLALTEDAAWLREGFTLYYAAKSLHGSGLWAEDELARAVGEYSLKGSGPVNKVEASSRLTVEGSTGDRDAVYFGGALLAYRLDGSLEAQGKSLDDLWPLLNQLNRPVSTMDFLNALEELGGADLARQADDFLHGRQ